MSQLPGSPPSTPASLTSPLSRIPGSIRSKIFGYLLTDPGKTLQLSGINAGQNSFLPLGSSKYTFYTDEPAHHLFTNSILKVSQQVRHEALSILISSNKFRTEEPRRLLAFLEFLGPEHLQDLRHLELELIPWQWGMNHERDCVDIMARGFALLAKCRSLKQLTIDIPPIWAVQFESHVESLWSKEEIMSLPVFQGLKKLTADEVLVDFTDYQEDWFDDFDYSFTWFRDRMCDHTTHDAWALVEDVCDELRCVMTSPKPLRPLAGAQFVPKGVFPFLQLPRELRDEIYSYILIRKPCIRLIPADKHVREDEQATFFPLSPSCLATRVLLHPISEVNQQIRAESQEILYARNTFRLPSLKRLGVFLAYVVPYQLQFITSLSLHVQRWDPEDDMPTPETVFSLLSRCRKLSHLSLYLDVGFLWTQNLGEEKKLILVEQVKEDVILSNLACLRGIKKLEIRWIPFYVSPGVLDPGVIDAASLWESMEYASSWLREVLQLPREEDM